MEVDSTPPKNDISAAVRKAREELAAVVRALTEVLSAVAESEQEKASSGAEAAEDGAAKKEREARRSLEPVLRRFDALRAVVSVAEELHGARASAAHKADDAVAADERVALVERRAALMDEVRAKNEKLKVLIDHLRELHKDAVVLAGSYVKRPSAVRKTQA